MFSSKFALCMVVVSTVLLTQIATAQSGCTVTAEPCDNTWSSSQNQTFAFLGVGGPYVQLISYFGSSHACINRNVSNFNTSGSTTTGLPASLAICGSSNSLWTYGPGAITSFVYYNNSEGNCLSLIPNQNQPTRYFLGLLPCCHLKETSASTPKKLSLGSLKSAFTAADRKCTVREQAAQKWLEPDTTKNPYSRIQSLTQSQDFKNFCLTRTGAC